MSQRYSFRSGKCLGSSGLAMERSLESQRLWKDSKVPPRELTLLDKTRCLTQKLTCKGIGSNDNYHHDN